MNPLQSLEQFRALLTSLPEPVSDIKIVHPRISLFAAAYETAQVPLLKAKLTELVEHDTAFKQAIKTADADLRVYELNIENPGFCLEEGEAAHIIAYGMTAIEPGIDLICLGTVTSIQESLMRVQDGLKQGHDPLALLTQVCGRDVAALFGAIIAARMAGIRAILAGPQAEAALKLLSALNPQAAAHCTLIEPSGDEFPFITSIRQRRGETIAA